MENKDRFSNCCFPDSCKNPQKTQGPNFNKKTENHFLVYFSPTLRKEEEIKATENKCEDFGLNWAYQGKLPLLFKMRTSNSLLL